MCTLSPEFLTWSEDFESWYDAKTEDVQELIDEIIYSTSYIINEDAYDEFIDELEGCGITDASQFAENFAGEWEGVGKKIKAEFCENLFNRLSCDDRVKVFRLSWNDGITWEKVWYSAFRDDYNVIEFKGNTYVFRRTTDEPPTN